jgi:RimJ/RimL family protein N-acetyltransferase
MRIELADGYVIRGFRHADVASIVAHANNPNVARNLEDRFPHPYTVKHAEEWIARVRKQDPVTHFAIADPDQVIGCVGIEPREDVYRGTAELGYWLGETFWGKGIATCAVRAITAWGFESFDVTRIQARVFESNPASGRVLEKAGFTFEGRLRQGAIKQDVVMDLLVYAILRHEFEAQTS